MCKHSGWDVVSPFFVRESNGYSVRCYMMAERAAQAQNNIWFADVRKKLYICGLIGWE